MTGKKGKKAWKNINTKDVQDFIEEQTHQERRGPAAQSLADNELFFFDKSADAEEAQAVSSGKRKRQAEAKPLRSQLVIEQAHKARPVPLPPPRRKPGAPAAKAAAQQQPAQQAVAKVKRQRQQASHPLDIWGDDGLAYDAKPSTSERAFDKTLDDTDPAALARRSRPPNKLAAKQLARGRKDLKHRGPSAGAARPMRALVIDAPGCSFNPEHEAHQDALAAVVAAEMKKVIARELAPAPIPLHVELGPGESAHGMDELAALQVEEDEDEEEEEGEGEEGADGQTGGKRKEKKTKKDRNKEARRKAAEREAASRSALKAQRRALASLESVAAEVDAELQEKQARLERRQADLADKAAVTAPKLGKLKYEPGPTAVLTSDEVTGSLRKLKACPLLASDRFKSLQRRGLIEPRKPALKRVGKRVAYEKDARREKAIAAQQEVEGLQRKRVALERQLAAQR